MSFEGGASGVPWFHLKPYEIECVYSAVVADRAVLSFNLNMSGGWCLLCLWTLIHAGSMQRSPIQFLELNEGSSAVLSCFVDHNTPPPFGFYLKRSWPRPTDILFKYERSEATVLSPDYRTRTTVSGDPSISAINVTISDLRPSDTDRYYCEFNFNNPHSEDTVRPGNTEFFLFVRGGDTPAAPVDRECVDICVGGSAVLPCVPPVGTISAVEGVILKRQRGQQPGEILYHSKRRPEGISYNVTVAPLQPEDSGLYSCHLLQQGRHPNHSMGHQVYVSVQGAQCGCSSYSALIYALSAAGAVTFILLLVVVLMYRRKQQCAVQACSPAPIYEEMSGLQPKCPKRSQNHLEEAQSEYRNVSVKKTCSENHYESPTGALGPKNTLL